MKDLTQGPITKHLILMALPMAIGMLVQTAYIFVDLYFVARIGNDAIAGVGAASNFMMAIMALTQMLSVGSVALISHAVGAKDQAAANLIFNQSLVLAAVCSGIALVAGFLLASPYMHLLAKDPKVIAAGTTYLLWFTPGLALQFAVVAMSAALRGTGIVAPTFVVQIVTVLLNIVLAPILIAGIGTGHPLGVAGAGLASSLAIVFGVAVLSIYFFKLEKYVAFHGDLWRPRFATWRRILDIGLPAGGEFGLMFVYTAVIYGVIQQFGAEAQAGFGVGVRVMQAVFLPAMAISFAVAPVAGQNFGAKNAERVRRTFLDAALLGAVVMALCALFCWLDAPRLIGYFADGPRANEIGVGFLRMVSWNFVMSGLVFTCSGMFQALGNTWPSVYSSGTRLLTFALPVLWMSTQPWFQIQHVWYLSVATVLVQLGTSLWLLNGELKRRLEFAT